jgi:hypothetical protein
VKTVRFAKVVERCGAPETCLVLVNPANDAPLQKAVKSQRVMTVLQGSVGSKADRGQIGFHPGRGRQFLVFPKSLKPFADRTVVGMKYELIRNPEVPKSQRVKGRRLPKKPTSKRPREIAKGPPAPNVVAFKPPVEEENETHEHSEVTELKRKVRRAMAMLEGDKPIAALNLLKHALGDV